MLNAVSVKKLVDLAEQVEKIQKEIDAVQKTEHGEGVIPVVDTQCLEEIKESLLGLDNMRETAAAVIKQNLETPIVALNKLAGVILQASSKHVEQSAEKSKLIELRGRVISLGLSLQSFLQASAPQTQATPLSPDERQAQHPVEDNSIVLTAEDCAALGVLSKSDDVENKATAFEVKATELAKKLGDLNTNFGRQVIIPKDSTIISEDSTSIYNLYLAAQSIRGALRDNNPNAVRDSIKSIQALLTPIQAQLANKIDFLFKDELLQDRVTKMGALIDVQENVGDLVKALESLSRAVASAQAPQPQQTASSTTEPTAASTTMQPPQPTVSAAQNSTATMLQTLPPAPAVSSDKSSNQLKLSELFNNLSAQGSDAAPTRFSKNLFEKTANNRFAAAFPNANTSQNPMQLEEAAETSIADFRTMLNAKTSKLPMQQLAAQTCGPRFFATKQVVDANDPQNALQQTTDPTAESTTTQGLNKS